MLRCVLLANTMSAVGVLHDGPRLRCDSLPTQSASGARARQGRNGAVSVIALAERGALFDPGPCMCATVLP